MRRFLACLRMDLQEGIRETWKRYVMLGAVCAAVLAFSDLLTLAYGDAPTYSWGENMAACLVGISPYNPEQDSIFTFPVAWMFVLMVLLFVTLSYPYRDLLGYGRSVLVLSGSRVAWWASKCLWVVISTFAAYLVVAASCVLGTLAVGGGFDLQASETAFMYVLKTAPDVGLPANLAGFLAVAPLMLCGLGLLQLALSLVLGPVLSFGVMAAILLASAYLYVPFLPGEYLMAARTASVLYGGFEPSAGALYALALALASAVLGGIYFWRMDCLQREATA